MPKRTPRIYVDTSVFGGVFDREFAEASKIFFFQARQGSYQLVTSTVVEDEILDAPQRVQELFTQLSGTLEMMKISDEAVRLRRAYLEAGIVTRQSMVDALHVAMATIAECTAIVSWNFKHIVNFQRIPMYNAVNVLKGFSTLSIISPQEVIPYEDQSD